MKTILYYLGSLTRFATYLSIWLLFLYALLQHFGSIQKTFSVDYFLYATLRTLIDISALTLIAAAYFLGNPSLKNYILWVLFGLVLTSIFIYSPSFLDSITLYSEYITH